MTCPDCSELSFSSLSHQVISISMLPKVQRPVGELRIQPEKQAMEVTKRALALPLPQRYQVSSHQIVKQPKGREATLLKFT